MTNDTVSDMLTRIRNANNSKHHLVQVPATKMTRNIVAILKEEGFIEDFDSKEKALTGHWLRHPQTPSLALKRFGNPDEVAEVIANLCKKEADYINGQTLHVNGGSFTP